METDIRTCGAVKTVNWTKPKYEQTVNIMEVSRPISPTGSRHGRTAATGRAAAPVDVAALRRHIATLERRPTALEGATCGTMVSWCRRPGQCPVEGRAGDGPP